MSDTEPSYYRTIGFKAALLSLSLITIMSGAGIAPGLNKLSEAFPNAPEALVKLVLSLLSLFMIFSALLTGISGRYLKPKTWIISGLTLFVAGGVGAGFVDSLGKILFFRAVLGLGRGIILPFSTGLIASCYQGAEKSRMMGFSFSANTLGAIIGNISAGILASLQWNYMFHIYWIGLAVLIPAYCFLNRLPDFAGPKKTEKLPSTVYPFALFALLVMMVFFLMVTDLSSLVKQKGIGTSQITGLLFSINSLTMLAAGGLLSYSMRLKKFFLPTMFLTIAAGLFGIARASTLPSMFTAVILSGIGIGSLFPYLLNLFSGKLPPAQTLKAMSIVIASAWFGQFLSPLFFNGISYLTGFGTSLLFMTVAGIFMFLSIGSILFYSKTLFQKNS